MLEAQLAHPVGDEPIGNAKQCNNTQVMTAA
jgi:hypothetical protein